MLSVNIVTSDRGWILERLATEITSRLDYVQHTDFADPYADINYYITYSCWNSRVSRIEIGWFAHLEPLGEARDKFFATAESMDHCLTQASMYEDMLRQHGVGNVSTISPGVDLERFTPKLNIGVVGRAYHTGRKGEHLVGQLFNMPEIAWHFTGVGWPGPALELSDERLPQFYRDMDYILVPSLYEGGPMCVVEALASGTEVISSPVGWVPDFPHIEFETGNVESLRRVLLDLHAKKLRLRETVLDRTWSAWADRHHELFQSLAERHPDVGARVATRPTLRMGRPALLMHGNEANSQGGPSVRVPRTAKELNKLGVRAEALSFNDTDLSRFDPVHVFNVWAPQSALKALRQAKRQNRISVFSPIFLDLSERLVWDVEVLNVFRHREAPDAIDAGLAEIARRWSPVRTNPDLWQEPVQGYFSMVREMISLADHLILLSEKERQLLTAIGAQLSHYSVVQNPTDNAAFRLADPNLFGETYGFKDFVLCVGRVEARKNQLMLAHALRDTGIPLVLIGHTPSNEYRELIERHGGGNVHFLGRLQAGSDLLLSAFRAARVATLPSWSEGAPLAALEAGAAGAPLVLSDRSSEPEYFGSLARYVDPADPSSIRNAILEAYESPRSSEAREAQVAHVESNFSWATYTQKTKAVYESAVALRSTDAASPLEASLPTVAAVSEAAAVQRIIVDVTTSVNRRGRWTGIARVEMSLAMELAARPDVDVRFVSWDNRNRRVIEVPFSALQDDQLQSYRDIEDHQIIEEAQVDPGAVLLVAGSGWMQNAIYAEGIIAFAQRVEAEFTVIIHDLIPVLFPYWFNDEYVPVFERNMRAILSNADRIVAISETTKQDVEGVLRRIVDVDVDVITFREGDQIGDHEAGRQSDAAVPSPSLERFANTNFVIAVGAIHARKNHKVLYDVWVRLAEQLGGRCPTLLIIGGIAWNGTDLARSIKNDKRLRGKIILLDDIDDAGLDWLYRNCMFTAYPSLYEGWGLPVCESLRYGKICLASNAASIQEIAPDVTDLLDPLDFAAWYTRIRFYATSDAARREREAAIRAGYQPTPWADSAAELSAKLRLPFQPNRDKARYHLGAVASFAAGNNLRRLVRGRWHISESWGAWTAEPQVAVEFFLPTLPLNDLVLAMKVKGLPAAGERLEVAIKVNGQSRTLWAFHNQTPQIRFVKIDRSTISSAGMVRIEFNNSTLFKISESTSSATDHRVVGLGVYAAVLTEVTRSGTLSSLLDPNRECDDVVQFGERFSLLDGRRPARMFAGEWKKSSAWGNFALSDEAVLYMPFDFRSEQEARLRFGLRSAATQQDPIEVKVVANGQDLATWRLDNADMVERDVSIPAAVQDLRQPVELRFLPSERCSPKERGSGQEEQALTFGLFELQDMGTHPTLPRPDMSLPVLELDETLAVLSGSISRNESPLAEFLRRGWYGPEKVGTWLRSHAGELAFQLQDVPEDGVIVTLKLRAFGTKQQGPLHVRIRANTTVAVEATLASDDFKTLAVIIGGDAIDISRSVRLAFECERAVAPSSIGTSKDDRLLSVQLAEVTVKARVFAELGHIYNSALGSPMQRAFLDGWHIGEPSGRWSTSGPARLRCGVDRKDFESVALQVEIRIFGSQVEGTVAVDVASADKHLTTWYFPDDEHHLMTIDVPLVHEDGSSIADLTFTRRGVVSPAGLNLGEDSRELGVWIGDFTFLLPREDRVEIGDHIDLFGPARQGSVPSVLKGAWYRSASWGFCPEDATSAVMFHLDPAMQDGIVLDFTLRAVATIEQPRVVGVMLDGIRIDTWTFTDSHVQKVRLPLAQVGLNGMVKLAFASDDVLRSPQELTVGSESRKLLIGLFGIEVMRDSSGPRPRGRVSPAVEVGEEIEFRPDGTTGAGTAVVHVLARDWFGIERGGAWSRGRSGTLAFACSVPEEAPVWFSTTVRVMAFKTVPNKMIVCCNGHQVYEQVFSNSDYVDLEFPIPAEIFHGSKDVEIQMLVEQAWSPSRLGNSSDDRTLGVMIKRMKMLV